MKYIIFATVLNSHKMESKEYFEDGMDAEVTKTSQAVA